MDSIAARLKSARIRAGFVRPVDAARAFGWKEPTYHGHENGDRNPSRNTAEKYARALRVSVAWLLHGQGDASPRNVFPVFGYVGLGEGVELLDTPSSPMEEIELPFGFSVPDCGALICRGNSQHPRVKDGDVVIYHRNGLTPDALIGREAIVGLASKSVMMKRILRGSFAGVFNLESHNAPLIENAVIEWCGEVMAIVPQGQWRKVR